MNQRRSFYRKVGYLVAIALLWIPVSLLSQPASLDAEGYRSPGGVLARLREKHRLSQSTLGDIDPTSETIKLATLGLRGVAVQLLWNSAQQYQMKEDWTSLAAVLEQIIRLQPNFFSVWDYQSHNLSYNISVEFDDYRDRFYWVMRGIEFLKDGVTFNRYDPRFLARVGWIYGNKIGRADEHLQYRRMFRKAQEEKGEKRTDNWLESYDWFIAAQKLVDSGVPLRVYISGQQDPRHTKPGDRAPSPLLFHSEPAMALINYANTMEEEGTFGDAAKAAWENAAISWQSFARRDVPTTHGYSAKLGEMEALQQEVDRLKEQLEQLLPGESAKVREERRAKLPTEQRQALDKDPKDRTPEESQLAFTAEQQLKVTAQQVALRAAADRRAQAREIASEIADLEQMISTIDVYRGIVNYDYWWARCQAEPTDACLAARELIFQASKAYADGELFEARELYEKSFAKWRVVLDQFPVLRKNTVMADELVDEIKKYKKVLGRIPGAKFPDNFILQDVMLLSAYSLD